MKANENDLQTALCQFLMKYRSSPHASTGKTPASLMFNREITTRLSLLFPDAAVSKKTNEKQKGEEARTFRVNDPVWIRLYSGNSKWSSGIIVKKCGPRNYKVQKVFKRHVDQLHYRHSEFTDVSNCNDFDDFPSLPEPATATPARYPCRTRHPPERLTY